MLGWIAATTGGLIKDTTVLCGNVWDTLVDEVSSVPDAFGQGLEHGLFTGEDLPEEEVVDLDHHLDTDESKHVEVKRFGKAS